ncbi:MAG TPA: calcium-binding protein [Hyphomicrobiaceae bacterium]|nr:calcium-binding protein [Hyphomicrobiaceae bacterium]
MATFTGTSGNNVINSGNGTITGFTGGTLAQLQDGVGDTFNGLGGDDVIASAGGADIINAGDGNDDVSGRAGNDTMNGGNGFDELRYDREAAGGRGVTVNLATGIATDAFLTTDSISNFEIIRGTAFADTFIGGNPANGSAVVGILDGFEAFRGLNGADTITGGAGYDEVQHDRDAVAGGTGAVTVNLITQRATDGFGTIDILSGIEGARGTNQGDTLIGNSGDNTFTGLGGADTITGGDGIDTLRYDRDVNEGGAGGIVANLQAGTITDGFGAVDSVSGINAIRGTLQNDSFVGNNDVRLLTDQFQGLAGNDTIDGGIGYDEARYDNDEDFNGTLGVNVNLATGIATDGFGNTDSLISIENVRGTSRVDTLVGDGANNRLAGLAGNDTIDGGAGNDAVEYRYDEFNGASAGVSVNLVTNRATDGFGNIDTLISIESAGGTSFADTFLGNAGNNAFTGFAGNDTINGGTGVQDTVRYDGDWIYGGLSGVNVNLATGVATDGFGNTDSLTGIEWVRASRFADTLTGSADNNLFAGLMGSDTINGGAGVDIAAYVYDILARDESVTLQAVNVNLTTGIAVDSFGSQDSLTAIESAWGGLLNDTFYGNSAGNTFAGFAGNDTMNGIGGFDTADYSQDEEIGRILFLSGNGAVTVNLVTGLATDGFGNTDTLINMDGAIGTAYNDTMTGNAAANRFVGGAGIDTLNGGDGNDTLDGGVGNDSLTGGLGDDTYNIDVATDIVIELANQGTDTVASTGNYTLKVNFENLTLLGNATTGNGNTVANIMIGNVRNNVLAGKEGNDTITTGLGTDTVIFDRALNAATNVDHITDFDVVSDTIRLASNIFTAAGPLGTLDAVAFVVGASAGDSSDRIIYNSATGEVFYDADGDGTGAQVLFVVLDNAPATLSNLDFIVA